MFIYLQSKTKTIIQMKNKANINQLLNLKFKIIESLRKQGYKSNWTYPTLKTLNIHQIHFNG